jgi:hypothetical protein
MSDHPPSLYASTEEAVFALAASREIPAEAVTFCAARYFEAGPLLRASLLRGANGAIDSEEDAQLLFRGLFIIGGQRDPLGFEPLLRLLRRPPNDVEWLLGDAITEELPRIVAGVFDGNAEALFAAILDPGIEAFARVGLLGAAAFLTWEGRIDRDRMTAFLVQFHQEPSAPEAEVVWGAWMEAVALLGLRALAPLVQRAWDEDLALNELFEIGDFAEILERAEREPGDIERFTDERLGYIEDVTAALAQFSGDDDGSPFEDDSDPFEDGNFSTRRALYEPTINPMRHVGRNDPCPCGSGKKAKRCCLAA